MHNGSPNPSRHPPPQRRFLDRKGQNDCTWAMMGLDLQCPGASGIHGGSVRQLPRLVGPTADGPQRLPPSSGRTPLPSRRVRAAHMHAYGVCHVPARAGRHMRLPAVPEHLGARCPGSSSEVQKSEARVAAA